MRATARILRDMTPSTQMTPEPSAAPPLFGTLPPAPHGHPFLGNVPDLRDEPLSFLTRVAREQGDVARLRLVQDIYLLSHPDHVKHVLQDNHLNYQKGFGYDRLEPLIGKGLLTSEGDFWKRQRRLAQPAFHRQRIAGFTDIMVRRTNAMLDGWAAMPAGTTIDAHAEMMKLTFAIVGDALFSVDLLVEAEQTGRALKVALEVIDDRFSQYFVTPKWVPTPENHRFYRAIATLEKVVNDIIVSRRDDPGAHNDLLAMFMEIRDADTAEGMTDRQLRDEVMTMVLAGHETSANALAYTWYLLSMYPEAEARVHQEVVDVLGDRSPTMEDLSKLSYTTRVIQEALRLYPPAWLFGRRAIGEDVIGGYRIPAGTTLFLSPYVVHRDPRFWENPEAFDPDRFLPEAVAARPKLAWFPFAAGPRMCIGMSFAMMELQLAVALTVRRFRLPLQAGTRLELEPRVTLRPSGPVPVQIRPRSKQAA